MILRILLSCIVSIIAISCFSLPAKETKLSKADSIKAKEQLDVAWNLKFEKPDSAIQLSKLVLKNFKTDAIVEWQVNRNIAVCYSIMGLLDSAKIHNKLSLKNAERTGNKKLIAASYQNMGIVASQTGDNNEAILFYQKIDEIANDIGDSTLMVKNLNNIGLSYAKLGLYEQSINSLMKGLQIAESNKDTASMINFFKNISDAYFETDNMMLAQKYAETLLNTGMLNNDKRAKALAYNSLATIFVKVKDYPKAFNYYMLDREISIETSNIKGEAIALHGMGNVKALLKQFDEALSYFYEALKIKKEIGNKNSIARTYNSLAAMKMEAQGYRQARFFLDSALFYSINTNDFSLKKEIYENLFSLNKYLKEFKLASEYADSLFNIKERIQKSEFQKFTSEHETRYQTEKKQQQIELQQAQLTNKDLELKHQQTRLLVFVLIAMSLLSIGVVFVYFFRRKKQQQLLIAKQNEALANQEYQNLFQESQLQAIREKIAGQEEERTRIARELHDGIGGTLAAVKMRMENAITQPNPEDMASLAIIVNNTWEEVRTISHNLMPPQFTDVAINQVLYNHIRVLNQGGNINFSIQFLPQTGWESISVNLQVELYRIVQELCSNIAKHSTATKVELQLSHFEGTINLTLEDNGEPFDYNVNGIGYRNLTERLKLLKGNFEKSSGSEGGNTYLIQIPLEKSLFTLKT